MEFLQVFDEKKNKLEEKVSRDEKYNLPSDRRFMIVLIFIENSKGEFLLQKTSKSRHSCIATTGGHVTYGDSALETVVKECKEELGIDVSANEITYIDTVLFKNCFLETFYTKMELNPSNLTLQTEEVESVKWYTKDEISEFIKSNEFREGNIKPYEKVLEYLKMN